MSRYAKPVLRLTAAQFTASNPTPEKDVICFETDTSNVKIGNGYSKWNALSYVSANRAQVLINYKKIYSLQGDPETANAAASLTVAKLLAKIITCTQATGATIALTLPTGEVMNDAFVAAGAGVGESIDWTVINLSSALADTATITASTGHTIVGNPVVLSSHAGSVADSSATFRSRMTAADTFVTYRIG